MLAGGSGLSVGFLRPPAVFPQLAHRPGLHALVAELVQTHGAVGVPVHLVGPVDPPLGSLPGLPLQRGHPAVFLPADGLFFGVIAALAVGAVKGIAALDAPLPTTTGVQRAAFSILCFSRATYSR